MTAFVCAAIMSRVVICCTSSVGGRAGQEGGEATGLAGVAALGDGPELGLVGGDRGMAAAASQRRPSRRLLLGGDGHLGLVHLLVDGGQVLGGLPHESLACAADPGAAVAADGREQPGRDREERGAARHGRHGNGDEGSCAWIAPSASVSVRRPGEGAIPCASERTVGKSCRQVAEGALVSFCASHHQSQGVRGAHSPLAPTWRTEPNSNVRPGRIPVRKCTRAHIGRCCCAGGTCVGISRRGAPGPAGW